jgi:hypothetical protein
MFKCVVKNIYGAKYLAFGIFGISTLLAHDAGIFLYVCGKPSVIVHKVVKKVWRSGRVADCNPVGRRFAPRMLLLKLSSSVEQVRHLQTISLTAII